MTPEQIAELEKAYNEAFLGTESPDYMELNIPEIGFIQAANGGTLLINGIEATREQAHAVAKWLNFKR